MRLKILTLSIIAVLLTVSVFSAFDAFADVSSPKKQTNAGISTQNVFCKENLYKVILKASNKPFCVSPDTAKKMMMRGITVLTDTQNVDRFVEQIMNKSPIGTIKKLVSLKVSSGYHVVFEACAEDQGIRAPEVIVTSDSETRYVKLVERLLPNSCETNSVQIKASNPNSIKMNIANKGGVTAKINQLENKVKDLQEKLAAEKAQLGVKVKDTKEVDDATSTRISQIVGMRSELNQAREELNRYLFALNLTPKIKTTELDVKKSFAGTPLEGILVNKLGVSKQIQTEGSYDVVFEMCSGKQLVRIPVVMVKSDSETKNVRLADKIIPETCQVTGAKIKANAPESIEVSVADTAQNSVTASDLEAKLTELTKFLQTEKQLLKDLTHFEPRPDDFNNQALVITQKIIDLRNEINMIKLQLFNILNQASK